METLVNPEMIQEAVLGDEYIFRQLALSIVKDVPFEELLKIFKFTKHRTNYVDAEMNKYKAEVTFPDDFK